ncbi:U3 small nucleolar RNA-associated protein 6 homolog isoform X2 [Paramacrobiotus metropolitanus]|uniref:U3 small nucleolar RNA-associated protein 6 homolog isoform X2 n=1 Tax=Paramacrobiotus metropolitanus TaxID=2943436 RepID=UPI00244646B9|nr:U3 small nucleolar RNA-associated protein 6 homolog isoform X2 [Paramacrobiotus metropolitanus]
MAEFVDKRLERGLGELEQMVRVGLFSAEERKAIIQKRKGLEYRVQRYEKSVDDHLEYIKHEMNFLDLIKLRRARLGYALKFSDIEGSIGKRCQARLQQAERRFPGSMEVWSLHIELCKKLNWGPVASEVYTRMLQLHSDKLDIWKQAADFELDFNGSPDNARKLCLKALRWHEKNPDTWRHHLAIEMRIAKKVFQRAAVLDIPAEQVASAEDAITSGKVALLVATNAMDTIRTLDFASSLYEQVLRFGCEPDAPAELWKPVSEGIMQHMEQQYSMNPEFALEHAKLMLMSAKISKNLTEYSLIKAESEAYAIMDKFIAENAVDNIPVDDITESVADSTTEKYWRVYLRFLVELRMDSIPVDWIEIQRLRFQKADTIYREADKRGYLTFDNYLSWAKICVERRKFTEALQIMKKAEHQGPCSVNDYHRLISLYETLPDKKDSILLLMQKARKKIIVKDIDFWQHMTKWVVEFSTQSEYVESFFRDGLKQSRPIIAFISMEFIQWAYKANASKGRAIYAEICSLPGVCTEAFVKCVIAEEERLNAPVAVLRKLYEQNLLKLGVDCVDLWIGYLNLESTHKDGDPMKCVDIAWRAKRALRSDLVTLFVTMSDLVINNTSPR